MEIRETLLRARRERQLGHDYKLPEMKMENYNKACKYYEEVIQGLVDIFQAPEEPN